MSTVIKCDMCGTVVPFTRAKHVKIYRLTGPSTYSNMDSESLDMCDMCLNKLLDKRIEEAKTDDK